MGLFTAVYVLSKAAAAIWNASIPGRLYYSLTAQQSKAAEQHRKHVCVYVWFAGATPGKADIEVGRQLMKSYAAAAPPSEARLLVLKTLRLFNSIENMAAAQAVLLSMSLDMAASVAEVHTEAGEEWHQQMIGQIKHVAANATQLKTRHSLPMLTGETFVPCTL